MIKNVKDNMQAILDIAEKTKNIELKQEILDLKAHILELQSENLELKTTLQENQKNDSYNMRYKNNMYVNYNADDTEEGRYCAICWDSEKKAIRLQRYNHKYRCDKCIKEMHIGNKK